MASDTHDPEYWSSIGSDDRTMLWHPYTSMVDPLPSYVVRRAEGVNIELADGRQLVDGMASWWAAIHGYNVPALNEAAHAQLKDMAHVMFGGLTHAPAVELGRRLLRLAPEGMAHVFFADSGSVAVEVALKMALQYQMGVGRPERKKMLGFLGGYHGDTAGAMALCDPVGGMHHIFKGLLAEHYFAERPRIAYDEPWDPGETARMRGIFETWGDELAAVFIEPVVQGAGGMWMYHPNYLRLIEEACRERGILLIADEIATGFGRTGRLWGVDHAGVTPDILCVGKALTGGYMTLAATMTTPEVAKGMAASEAGVLMHGPTFMANPLACAVANASLELFEASPWVERIAAIEASLRERLMHLKAHPKVRDVRVLGAIGVIQMTENVDVSALQRIFIAHGAWLRPFRDLIYAMPPYIITEAELSTLTQAMIAGVESV